MSRDIAPQYRGGDFIQWLDAVVDWAESHGYRYDVVRCKFDGWLLNVHARDVAGPLHVAVSPRVRRKAEPDMAFISNSQDALATAVNKAREARNVSLRRLKRMAAKRAA